MRVRTMRFAAVTLAVTAVLVSVSARAADDKAPTKLTDSEAAELAEAAYVFGYPLVLMDVTRAGSTAVSKPSGLKAPSNQFAHTREIPDVAFIDVISPNVDALYSTAWLDLAKEPIILSVPAIGGRYYSMQIMDAWTNVFAHPGSRTTGAAAGDFAIVGPNWTGELPKGVQVLKSPTNMVWIVGRTQINGKDDYTAVHSIQDQYKLVPLSAWGKNYSPESGAPVAKEANPKPPVEQVAQMDAGSFFARLNELMKNNPPTAADRETIKRFASVSVAPGELFDLAKREPTIAKAVERGVRAAREKIEAEARKPRGKLVNNWSIITDGMGRFEKDYLFRSAVAQIGLGANLPEDALYPSTRVDGEGSELTGTNRYVIHFAKDQLPPVGAFWSLTMYNSKRGFVDNRINRYAIGDRNNLTFNEDGSLTLYVQYEPPGREKEPNWLPASQKDFNLVMRLYSPKKEVLDGAWKPPAVQRVGK